MPSTTTSDEGHPPNGGDCKGPVSLKCPDRSGFGSIVICPGVYTCNM